MFKLGADDPLLLQSTFTDHEITKLISNRFTAVVFVLLEKERIGQKAKRHYRGKENKPGGG
jgi:hypothetical protein